MTQAGSIVCLIVGAAVVGLMVRVPAPPTAWIALTLLVYAARSMPAWPGLAYVSIALYVAMAIGNRGVIPAPDPVYFGLVAMATLTVVFPFAVDRIVAARFGGLASTLIFPLAYVAAEFLQSRYTPAATWGSIAYTQYGNLPLMQVAAVAGLWGITFLIAWFASTMGFALEHRFEWAVVRTPVLTLAAVFGAVLLGGALRLADAPTDRPSMRAATINRPVDLFMPGEITRITEGRVAPDQRPAVAIRLARLQDWFLGGSRREARAGARLIVWPEQNLLVFDRDEPAFLDRAKRLAADEKIYLAMGMGTIHLDAALPFENKLVLIDPSGRVVVSYLKSHPVYGWEASIMRVGDGRVPIVETADGRMAGAICFDGDFPEFVRQAAQGSADLFILPSNDWREVKTIHLQMAAFRAVETGVPLVRAAASGISTAFDSWGRALGVADFFAPGDRTLTVQVPVGGIGTIYGRIGDLFAWLCVAALFAVIAVSTMRH